MPGKKLSRENIVRALLDTAKLALFGLYNNCSDKAADEDMASSERSVKQAIPDGRGGNGTMQTIRSDYFAGYRKRMNELTKECE